MKIDGINPIDGKPLDRSRSVDQVKGASFNEVLNGLTQSSETARKADGVGSIPQMPFITPPLIPSSNASQGAIVGNIESILTDLDMFGNALGNQDISLQRLQPLVDELVAKKDELASLFSSTPDEELKSLISNTLKLVMDQMSQYHTAYAA